MQKNIEIKKVGYTVDGNTHYDILVDGIFFGEVWKTGKFWMNGKFATISTTRKEAIEWLFKD